MELVDVTLITAFGGGLVSFISPCVLPMIPVYLASLYGPEIFDSPRRRLPVFLHSLSFVIGFSVVFTLLGAIAGLTGYAIIPNYALLTTIAGWVLIAFGVFILASVKVPWLNFEKRLSLKIGGNTGYVRSLLIGAVFSVSWTACVGPILGSILALASTATTAWQGAYLLAVYSLGLGLPFLIVGAAFDTLLPWLKKLNRFSAYIRAGSGILLIIVGILLVTGNLTWINSLAA